MKQFILLLHLMSFTIFASNAYLYFTEGRTNTTTVVLAIIFMSVGFLIKSRIDKISEDV
ncbi:MAG: hypothetical protein RL264_670 [Bacteroidota bacterium]|jgi:hypothetical protein